MSEEEIIAFNVAEEKIINSCSKTIKLYKEKYINRLKNENQKLKKKLNKAIELLIKENLPCDIEEFNIRNADYCSSNCSVDEEIFKKCWLKYIEQELENDNR